MCTEKEETPVPGTAAKDGRRKLGAYAEYGQAAASGVQSLFVDRVAACLSVERLESYGTDGVTPTIALARYLLNLALCESLYSQLQLCEVALRNQLHRYLSLLIGREDWFHAPGFRPTPWAEQEIRKAIERIRRNDRPVTAGRVVAELQFGFWTSLFEGHYEEHGRLWPAGIKIVFPHLVKSRHRRKEIKRVLEEIRYLRNRVFHHERIVHWSDLPEQHRSIIEVIGWASPEAQEMARALDRFAETRSRGLAPWIAKLRHHWPETVGK